MQSSDVAQIANLAKLAADASELDQYASELTDIFAMVADMNACDTSAIEPLAHPLELTQRLRPDDATEPDRRELFQSIAPMTKDGFYLVPRVIE
ncbi:Asp-tRNA(Asn)/Glu-tRNA(Gln) amidotransferase subunit GatC [Thiorhodovibrio frisius]|uniref:Aspartyl/glutamyl-tRNA(Asn/Gln) amidotransferase subunit C n=1 Tax=Thiorhodovibrio frisius TaxID=631362 RepID=H8Z6M6_9GAMM|nr:Asp-tRNA(Asn)/Glu-tRNA(Gln) amidotransferase subunit GatC [Thiorhodovibrio frisius]EIC19724.1 glutamyl-tRNA(Gln) and/or aspartyl-tRNA(Asn) amidotransferase, C subunit [Thiorhodovibrio frisius]WPL20308.1 Glutamyl-tRNA(Gln) amidotransferase subunit C [Thiorhodovibrio frisius]